MKMFLFYPKLPRNLVQMGFKEYDDDMISDFFYNMTKIFVTSSKSKVKFSNDLNSFKTV